MSLHLLLKRILPSIKWRIRHEKMAERKSWLKIIGKLKKFVADVGTIWEGTTLIRISRGGPYFCGECHYLKGYS